MNSRRGDEYGVCLIPELKMIHIFLPSYRSGIAARKCNTVKIATNVQAGADKFWKEKIQIVW